MADYMEAPKVTFTHVFFDTSLRGDAARTMAQDAVRQLVARREGFSAPRDMGDRFRYLVNYVDRPLDFVAEHFGADFARDLAGAAPIGRWHGPVKSQYGWHAVLATGRVPAAAIPFEQARGEVAAALAEQLGFARRKQALDRLRRDYDVRIDLD